MAFDYNSWIVMFMVLCVNCNVYGEILTHCGDKKTASVGDSHSLSCSGIPSNSTIGIRVFFNDGDSIISCTKDTKTCKSTDPERYTVESPHTDIINFNISSIQSKDAGKYFCSDSASNPDEVPSTFCTLVVAEDALKYAEIAGIVIGTIVIVLLVVLISYVLIMKKCVLPKRSG